MLIRLFDVMVFSHPLCSTMILNSPPIFGITFKKLWDLDCILVLLIIPKQMVS